MKNKDLVEELKQYNPDADVTLTTSEDICLSYVYQSPDGELDKKSTPIVFIEPRGLCPSCASEYMNYDEMWCSHYDCPCKDVEDCEYYEEFDY